MTNNGSSDQLDLKQVAALLQQSIVASNDRMTKLEQSMVKSDERLTRIEQAVESNNRFLEGFSQRIDRYTTRMDNLAHKLDTFSTRIDGVIFTANQDRQETNSRLASIQRQMNTIESKVEQLLDSETHRETSGSQIQGGDDLPA